MCERVCVCLSVFLSLSLSDSLSLSVLVCTKRWECESLIESITLCTIYIYIYIYIHIYIYIYIWGGWLRRKSNTAASFIFQGVVAEEVDDGAVMVVGLAQILKSQQKI